MRISRFFTRGIMNKDSDERSVPQGMYRHAENIRVTNSDGSNAGLVENLKGMVLRADVSKVLSLTPYTMAETIGEGVDDFSECIYWLVATDGDDYLLEYNKKTDQIARVLQGNLNLSTQYPVSEIHVIRDSYSGHIYLTWTDDYNPPRFVNLQRAKGYPINGFTEDDISLIKKPPKKEPLVEMFSSVDTKENYLEEKFLAFAYRYKYLDGEYSALSSFTEYAFKPKSFLLDFATKENLGMVNSFNAIRLTFNTGSKRVIGVDLVYKESGSNTIYKIQSFNKDDEDWGHNEEREYIFKNDKVYSVLPERELYRLADSVPLKAKDMDIIDNRILLADITEGRNMVDADGGKIVVDYDLSVVGGEMINEEVPSESNTYFIIDFNGIELTEGKRLVFRVSVYSPSYGGYYNGVFDFILTQDFEDAGELYENAEFRDFVESVWTDAFLQGYQFETPEYSEILSISNFQVLPFGVFNGKIYIQAPIIHLRIDLTPNNPNDNSYWNVSAFFSFKNPSKVELFNHSDSSSLKSNRSYEVGLVYLDEHNRQSPTLVCRDNTVFVAPERSVFKNQIQVELKNPPPAWADRYKFVLKQNKWGHETIYISVFYFDGAFVWCLLDGANKDKVKDGDTLIVKSDADGVKSDLVKTRVLEIKEQPKGFLTNDEDTEDELANGAAGLYMKVRPNGFSFGNSNQNVRVFSAHSEFINNHKVYTSPIFGVNGTLGFEPYELTSGSRVRIYIRLWRHGSNGFDITYDETYTVGSDYVNYKEWFETEADLSGFETMVVSESNVSSDGYIDPYEYGTGYGFSDDLKQFWVRHLGGGSDNHELYTEIKWEVYTAEFSNIIFETEPKELDIDIYYETGETFDIVDGKHQGDVQNQTSSQNAIVLLNSHNCFTFGNGVESHKIKDTLNGKALNIDTRPTTTIDDEYKERKLFSTFTWGGNYEEATQYNSLNEFNRYTLNIRQLDDKYGAIQRVLSREGNVVFFQDDKVSLVPYRKRALYNQDGSVNLTATDVDFDNDIPYLGQYGTQNPESVATFKNRAYFADRKRGVICRLSVDGIEEIPGYYYETDNLKRETMASWFRELFRNSLFAKSVGCYDPEYDEYVLSIQTGLRVSISETQKSNVPETRSETLAFNESAGGWTSFYTFVPERLTSLNGKLYAFKKGNLYECNADEEGRNMFFGEQYDSKIVGITNDYPSEVKVFNALNIEGNRPWDVSFKTNLTNGKVLKSEFRNIEEEWYANFRKSETMDTHSLATQGIGVVSQASTGEIKIEGVVNPAVCVGDLLYINNHSVLLGIITDIQESTIAYASLTTGTGGAPNDYAIVGGFAFAQKNARVEGSNIRGYFLEYEMTASPENRVELYSVNFEVSKSFP